MTHQSPDSFYKFPHTPHLLWLSPGQPREDKIMTTCEVDAFLAQPLVIEEKVDGANVGLSLDSAGGVVVQNRGSIIASSAHPQYAPLWPWVAGKSAKLKERLGANLILFGEWCFAVHSVYYDALPDYFLAFDVFDREQGFFLPTASRNELCAGIGVSTVPRVSSGRFDRDDLKNLLGISKVGSKAAEGIYLRVEDGQQLLARAKIVRAEFVQAISEHWTKRPMARNRLM